MSKITAYNPLPAAHSDDELIIVNVHDTSMASSGTDYRITAGALVGSQTVVAYNVKNATYGAAGNGVADDTTAIQNALAAAAFAGGGVVYLPAGSYKVSSTLTIGTNVTLLGDGPGASVLSAASGIAGSVLALAATSTRRTAIRNLTVEVNSLSGITGISLVNTGLSASTPPEHRLWNVIVNDAGQDGFFYGANVVECFTGFCSSFNAGRYGFNLSTPTDCRWVSCTSGQSVSHGWSVSSANNNLFALCKAYYAGYNGSSFTTGAGWYCTNSGRSSFSSCEAQDCAQNGWQFDTSGGACSQMAVHACVIDSCNAAAGSGALACGINTNTLTYSSIVGNTIVNRGGGAGTMANAIAVAGTQTGLWLGGNSTSLNLTYVSGGGYVLAEPYQWDSSGISGGSKFPASTFTGNVSSTGYASTLTGGGTISQGSGAPTKPNGVNPAAGDIWFRTDTPSTVNQRIYICTTGGASPVWSGIV